MACIHWDSTPQNLCRLLDRACACQGDSGRCGSTPLTAPSLSRGQDFRSLLETRNESLMKQAARLLAAAGGHRFRHYVVKVDSGKAMCIEEFDPPRPRKMIL